jgi:thymidylate synthase (FAD)
MPKDHPLVGKYFPVLDHGFVALKDFMGDDEDIVEAARVSYGSGTKKVQSDSNLLRYLFRKRHTSPFEMCEVKLHVKLPIFVARQLVRHRTAKLNEYSLRYSLAPLQYYRPKREVFQAQSPTNRQGRGGALEADLYDDISGQSDAVRTALSDLYVTQLENDVARELARIDLPLSLYTEWYWKLDLHNLLHFLDLRADPHAQWEIQEYARVKAGIVKVLFPDTFGAWLDYSYQAVTFSRMERQVLGQLLQGLPRGSDSIDRACVDAGMSKREIEEFRPKLEKPSEPPSFELDLASARTGEWFYEEAQKSVPKLEPKP